MRHLLNFQKIINDKQKNMFGLTCSQIVEYVGKYDFFSIFGHYFFFLLYTQSMWDTEAKSSLI